MAVLAIAGVPWQKWIRFFIPIFISWMILSVTMLVIAQVIQWS